MLEITEDLPMISLLVKITVSELELSVVQLDSRLLLVGLVKNLYFLVQF